MRVKALLLVLVLLLTGCSSDYNLIEELGMVRTITFDAIPDEDPEELLLFGFSIPLANNSNNILFTGKAKTSKQARSLFNRQNNRKLISGQLRQVLFGTDLAEKGIWVHIDAMLRDPTIGKNVFVALVDGEALPILQKRYIQDPTKGEYIMDLMERSTELTDIPKSNLHTFSRDYYEEGVDPVLPILKVENNMIRIESIGLFQEDRLVARMDALRSLIFIALQKNLSTGELTLFTPEDGDGAGDIVLGYINSKRKIKVTHDGPITNGENITVDLHVKLKGSLLNYTGNLNLSINENQRKLERLMAKHIEHEADAIIKTTQEHHVDPIGIGQYVRNSMPYQQWKSLQWREVYPNINVNVHIDAQIQEYGKLQ